MMVVRLQQLSIICASSPVNRVSTNLDEGDAIRYVGAGTSPARARSFDIDWDDDWSE